MTKIKSLIIPSIDEILGQLKLVGLQIGRNILEHILALSCYPVDAWTPIIQQFCS
jgi:hypothetical protein